MIVFPSEIYVERRARLRDTMIHAGGGVLLFTGNDDSPMNYPANAYPFRQDSSFLYFFGLDAPGLAAIIDLDEGREIFFGDDPTVDDIVWTGPQPSLRERCEPVGIRETMTRGALGEYLRVALEKGRKIHYLPTYRAGQRARLVQWLGINDRQVDAQVSVELIRGVVAQRSFKSPEEIEQIELAIAVTQEMQALAMRRARAGAIEFEIAGAMEGLAYARGMRLAFPTIFSVRGETLHNLVQNRVLRAGDLAVNDCGAESSFHYAGDMTRTLPIGGRFSTRQREIYQIVLNAQERAIQALKPGVEFREIHRLAAVSLVEGLRELGLMRGSAEEAVDAGAHTLFFPCGVGHMMGLDVHDMEGLGEDYVGYTESIRRNPAFGWKWLRLARTLEPGFVVTVEPGIYFIPTLIDRWRADLTCAEFICFDRLEAYRDFGGIRIEDNLLITSEGHRVLGEPFPKTPEEVEEMMK